MFYAGVVEPVPNLIHAHRGAATIDRLPLEPEASGGEHAKAFAAFAKLHGVVAARWAFRFQLLDRARGHGTTPTFGVYEAALERTFWPLTFGGGLRVGTATARHAFVLETPEGVAAFWGPTGGARALAAALEGERMASDAAGAGNDPLPLDLDRVLKTVEFYFSGAMVRTRDDVSQWIQPAYGPEVLERWRAPYVHDDVVFAALVIPHPAVVSLVPRRLAWVEVDLAMGSLALDFARPTGAHA